MKESENSMIADNYDTTLNVIGGIKDCGVIYKSIDSYCKHNDSLNDLVLRRNEFNLRSEKSRIRVERAVRLAFLQFKNQNHKELIQAVFQSNISVQEKELILFWQFALNNRLFREISSLVFMNIYFSGRVGINKDDIIGYLKEFFTTNKNLNLNWSESTINTLSTKYLNLMAKLNFLEGSRIKSFKIVNPTTYSLVIFLYFAKLHSPHTDNILKNEMLPLSFVMLDDIYERLKKLSLQGFFNMNFNDVSLNIELIHSYKGICNVLQNRSQTEI
ncbi:MAG: DUF1819 family protein [Desulfamplus sp.]|nr:DUF1819 family protein [Desulfamplus sp.]